MTKEEYICFHLICVANLQSNAEAEKLVKKEVSEFSDEEIAKFYLAVTGKNNELEVICHNLKILYEKIFRESNLESFTPSQMARVWQGKFEFNDCCDGYVERDFYQDESFYVGQKLYALVAPGNSKIPNYFFDEETFNKIKVKTTMDVYAGLQLDPYWSKGFGARTTINKYIVINDFVGACGYAHMNHHLSRELSTYEMLSVKEKNQRGIGKDHVIIDPYDEDHAEYEYIVPPLKQIFVPNKCTNSLRLNKANVYTLKNNMTKGYMELYKQYIVKAKEKRVNELRRLYMANKQYNNLP